VRRGLVWLLGGVLLALGLLPPAGQAQSVVELELAQGKNREVRRLFESRPMSIPEGAKPARLRVVGWVEDARGRIRAIAQSRCRPPEPKG